MDLNEAFEDAIFRVDNLGKQPNNVMLALYGLFKQARFGDVTGDRPSALDLRGRAKYDAWAAHKGKSHEDAITAYIEYAEELGA
jgi:diazepam-binding inhibitor (GABA receptor modulating acyl-CoA-binding protein)